MSRKWGTRGPAPGLALSLLILAGGAAAVSAADGSEGASDHDVVGRFAIESEAGGAVWAFQPSGALIVTGPGDLLATGDWSAGSGGAREFDATLPVEVTGQVLSILGEVSPDASQVALFVSASDPTAPEDWTPWPSESRLVGERFGFVTEATPMPTIDPIDCDRPAWTAAGAVVWDRCEPAPESSPTPASSPTAAPDPVES